MKTTTMTQIAQPEIKRDSYGRPLLFGRAWQRASTRAGALDDKGPLVSWKARQVASAYQSRPELRDMDVDEAIEMIESNDAAAYGTAVHAVIEAILHGLELPDGTTDEQIADAHAGLDVLDKLAITPVATELFVVNESIGCAGSLDLLGRWPSGGGVCIDWKTVNKPSSWRWSGLKWSVQEAIYANGRPLSEDGVLVDWAELGLPAPSTIEGLVVQIVQRQAEASAVVIDLERGLEAAKLAGTVLRARADRDFVRLV